MTTQAAAPTSPTQFDCGNVTEIPQAECEALVALYESTDGDNWTDNTDWLATNTPCSWYGVTCESANVTWLSLSSNQLSGSIPPEIGNLTALTRLYLSFNRLSGSIPPEIGNLTALTGIELYFNQLTGPIPPEIGNLTALEWLQLSDNQLSGAIPPEIGNLTTLEGLSLSSNQLSGPFPLAIGNLSALILLSLSSNQLNGPIPSTIGNLTALTELWLSGNQLSSTIPFEIGNLTALTTLRLDSNQLSGTIPPEIGNLTALTSLGLSNNQLSGPIPPWMGSLTLLTSLGLSRNQLSGAIPPEIGNLTALAYLSLSNNQLSSVIPPEIGNLTALRYLYLSSNQLSGPIPTEIGNLTALTHISLSSNQLSGPIPPEIGNLTALTSFSLLSNQLSGPIPPEIGNLTALTFLMLDNNKLSGPIPPAIGNLAALTYLWLNNNQLSGTIPSAIGNLAALRGLYLHNNPFSDELPTELTLLTLTAFTFYDTDWCVPSAGDVPTWLSSIPILYGTGIICGESLGSLSGAVRLTDTSPITGVQVNLYRSAWSPQWQYLTTTHSTANGTYQFTGLGQGLGIDYRVQFVDPTHQLAPQYYAAKPTIATANIITITPGVPRTGIDAVLALPQPPAAGVETESGSVAYNPDGTAQITMPAPNPSDITITCAVTCTAGTPTTVTLLLSDRRGRPGPEYPMTNVSGDLYQATIPTMDLGNFTVSVAATCGVTTTETIIGYITLYDPSGYVTDAQTGDPVVGATVTLYNVPGWEPKTASDDDRPNTCQSHNSKAADDPWDQPAPTHLGIVSNADVTPTEPKLPYQHTTADGYYGWDVSQGCWYVTVEAEGYEPLTSPVVGVPPEVTDLDLQLTSLDAACTPLTDVGIAGPLNVTSTLYIGTSYTFQAIITPTNATPPITYTWSPEPQTGQGTDTAVYRWSAPGTYTVTLTAENCGGTVEAEREFVVAYKEFFMAYLPLTLRNY